jgi:hypothetical protein
MPRLRTRIVPRPAAAVTDLAQPTPPAPQSLASSATTASLTWTHASAPAGTTYALTCTDETGASVSASSGSNLGPYVIPVASGKAYIARLRATGPDGQLSQSSALVAVAAAAGTSPGWDAVYDLDLTGLTVATLASGSTSPATTDVTRAVGGARVATVWHHNASNTGTVTAGPTGITADGVGAGGSSNALIDLEAESGLTLAPSVVYGLAIDLYMTGTLDMGTGSNAVQVGISATQERFSVGTNNTVQLLATALNQHTRGVGTNGAITSWATGQTNPVGAWCVTFLLIGGATWVFYGSSPASDADLDTLNGAVLAAVTIAADTTSASDGTKYSTALHAGIMGQLAAGTTWTRARIRRRRTS